MNRQPSQKKSASLGEAYRAVGPYMTLGIQFVATILVCVFAGRWIDGRYDMAPIFTLVGGFLGIAAGFYHFLKTVLRENRKPEDKG